MTVKAMSLRIKVAELNTLSVGKGITGIPSTGFLMRWKIQMKTQIYVNYAMHEAWSLTYYIYSMIAHSEVNQIQNVSE